MGDRVGEEEVERRAAALAGDVLDHAREAVAADEEREGLVLVRRPRHQLVEQERRCRQLRSRRRRSRARGRATNARAEAASGRVPGEASAVCVIGLRAASSLVDWPP